MKICQEYYYQNQMIQDVDQRIQGMGANRFLKLGGV